MANSTEINKPLSKSKKLRLERFGGLFYLSAISFLVTFIVALLEAFQVIGGNFKGSEAIFNGLITICQMILTFASIAVAFNNDEFLGTKVKDILKLRLSHKVIFIDPFIILFASVFFCCFGLIITNIVLFVLTIFISIYSVCLASPIILRDKKYVIEFARKKVLNNILKSGRKIVSTYADEGPKVDENNIINVIFTYVIFHNGINYLTDDISSPGDKEKFKEYLFRLFLEQIEKVEEIVKYEVPLNEVSSIAYLNKYEIITGIKTIIKQTLKDEAFISDKDKNENNKLPFVLSDIVLRYLHLNTTLTDIDERNTINELLSYINECKNASTRCVIFSSLLQRDVNTSNFCFVETLSNFHNGVLYFSQKFDYIGLFILMFLFFGVTNGKIDETKIKNIITREEDVKDVGYYKSYQYKVESLLEKIGAEEAFNVLDSLFNIYDNSLWTLKEYGRKSCCSLDDIFAEFNKRFITNCWLELFFASNFTHKKDTVTVVTERLKGFEKENTKILLSLLGELWIKENKFKDDCPSGFLEFLDIEEKCWCPDELARCFEELKTENYLEEVKSNSKDTQEDLSLINGVLNNVENMQFYSKDLIDSNLKGCISINKIISYKDLGIKDEILFEEIKRQIEKSIAKETDLDNLETEIITSEDEILENKINFVDYETMLKNNLFEDERLTELETIDNEYFKKSVALEEGAIQFNLDEIKIERRPLHREEIQTIIKSDFVDVNGYYEYYSDYKQLLLIEREKIVSFINDIYYAYLLTFNITLKIDRAKIYRVSIDK